MDDVSVKSERNGRETSTGQNRYPLKTEKAAVGLKNIFKTERSLINWTQERRTKHFAEMCVVCLHSNCGFLNLISKTAAVC
jgi:hypothetical protein